MSSSELNEIKDGLDQTSFTITKLKKTITGFPALNKFIENECAFWAIIPDSLNSNSILNHTKSNLNRIKNAIHSINQILQNDAFDSNTINNIQQLKDVITSYINNEIVFSEQNESSLLKNLIESKSSIDEINGAVTYFFKKQFEYTQNTSFFKGFIKAYEFSLQDNAVLAIRAKSELESLERIKTEWNDLIGDAQKKYSDEIKNVKNEIEQIQKHQNELNSRTDKAFKKIATDSKDWANNLECKFTDFEREKSGLIDKELSEKNKKFKELENTYNSKLQLEAPVKYWKYRIKKYKGSGCRWFAFFLILIAIILGYFTYFISNINTTSFVINGQFNPDSIKSILTFLTIVSFGAYLIKVFSKLTFSNFHLQRDSEERLQLTMVYLALLKDGTHQASPEDKKIILQSIFGRVETGLLGMDSSPTIPGINTVIEKVTGK
jgi:hypothetical protein